MPPSPSSSKPGCLTVFTLGLFLFVGYGLINAGLSGDTSSFNRPSGHRNQAAISPGQATLAGLVAITAVGSALWVWGRQPAEPVSQPRKRARRAARRTRT